MLLVRQKVVLQHTTVQDVQSIMPELISSPPFLIIVVIFAILLVVGIAKHAVRFIVWVSIIFVILLCLGIVKQAEILNWFENLFKVVK
ncbi:MAG: hypothetical protein OXU23_03235 [Candidatus Poribacteria bacterium]|nr:hypothetical protein [Candidatus Poribacteria bacterium]